MTKSLDRAASDPSKTRWVLILFLWGAGLLAAAQFAKISVFVQEFKVLYPENASNVALVVSTLGGVGIVFGTTAGALVARFGVRRMLLAAMVFGGVLSVLQASLPPFPIMLGLRALEGFAHLFIVVSVPPLMVFLARPSDRPVVMGLWGTFFGVGYASSALGLGWVATLGGVPAALIVHGLLLWALAAGLVRFLPGVMRSPGVKPPARLGLIAEHRQIYGSLPVMAPGLAFVWHTITFVSLLTFLPDALAPERAGVLASTLPLLSLVSTFGSGFVARHVAPLKIAMFGFLLTALAGAWMVVYPNISGAYLLFFLLGIAPGACFATIPALNHTPQQTARASGALAQLGNFGTGFGPPIYAMALAAAGVVGIMTLMTILSAAGAALCLFMFWRTRASVGQAQNG